VIRAPGSLRRARIPRTGKAEPAVSGDDAPMSAGPGAALSSYPGMLEFLYGLQALRGMRFGLGSIREALGRLGNPQRHFRSVHVAGTKGKGSTAALLQSILHEAGHRAALYTSPHLVDFGERFRIGREQAREEEILASFREVARACGGGDDPPLTFFEWCTAMAFVLFARRGVSVAVLEAGLGGRLDATRAAGGSLVLMSRIGLDHQAYLGHTVRAIAGEKAGLIGRGAMVVTAPQQPAALEVIRARSDAAGGRLVRLDRAARLTVHGTDLDGVSFDLRVPGRRLPRLWCPLPGRHQAVNSALAVLGALALDEGGWRVPDQAIRRGLAACGWPGRLEAFGEDPVVILDGAHNVDSARALAEYLREVFPGVPLRLVLGILADKDVRGIMRALAVLPARLYLAPCRSARTAPPETLAAAARSAGLPVQGLFGTVTAALTSARREAAPVEPVVVAGSLFAAAEARSFLLGMPPEKAFRLQ
jgi:dihydrofolate synthase/folylpolyglutamate synthase